MIRVLVLYPRSDNTTFDADYWLGTHMPGLSERMDKLVRWEADVAAEGPFFAAAHLLFDSVEDMGATMSGDGGAWARADIANYTNTTPTVSVQQVAKTS